MQDCLRRIAEARRKAEEEEERFRRMAEADPFNPEVQVSGWVGKLTCWWAAGRRSMQSAAGPQLPGALPPPTRALLHPPVHLLRPRAPAPSLQRRLMEVIEQANVQENFDLAYEHNPEVFSSVCML